MQLAISIASIVLSLCVIAHLYRLYRRLARLERAHSNLCDVLGIRHEFVRTET
jgi:cbb3-type cytochrome oxidase subunit 3